MAKKLEMVIGSQENPYTCNGCASRSMWEANVPKTIYLTITPVGSDGNRVMSLNYCYLCSKEAMLGLGRDLENSWSEEYRQQYRGLSGQEKNNK